MQHVSQTGAKSEAGKRGKSRAREFRRIVCGGDVGAALQQRKDEHPILPITFPLARLNCASGWGPTSRVDVGRRTSA